MHLNQFKIILLKIEIIEKSDFEVYFYINNYDSQ